MRGKKLETSFLGSAKYQYDDYLENFMKNLHKNMRKSYVIHWTDILESNDAEKMTKRSAALVSLICFGFTGTTNFMLL